MFAQVPTFQMIQFSYTRSSMSSGQVSWSFIDWFCVAFRCTLLRLLWYCFKRLICVGVRPRGADQNWALLIRTDSEQFSFVQQKLDIEVAGTGNISNSRFANLKNFLKKLRNKKALKQHCKITESNCLKTFTLITINKKRESQRLAWILLKVSSEIKCKNKMLK